MVGDQPLYPTKGGAAVNMCAGDAQHAPSKHLGRCILFAISIESSPSRMAAPYPLAAMYFD